MLVPLENTLAILEFALPIADLAHCLPIEEANPLDALLNRVAVRPGVSINRAAHPSGDAGHGFETA